MVSLSDVSQVRAFLGCCQQMSQYIIKDYGITAAPLHGLTKKARAFPKPWIKGTDYDLSFESLRSSILDLANFLHHKDCRSRLFIEVDASDAGWGACAYQMVHSWTGPPDEEGRGRHLSKQNHVHLMYITINVHEIYLRTALMYIGTYI